MPGFDIQRCSDVGWWPVAFTLLICVVSTAHARNVVLIIGDGMDDHQITIARAYLKGDGGRLNLDNMPLRSSVRVLTVDESNPALPIYVADSANSATAMATGIVTSRGRIATSAGSDEDLPTLLEMAHAAGMRTGIVTTSSITDATPASFMAHIRLRMCEDPSKMVDYEVGGTLVVDCSADLKKSGGPGSIAEQIADSNVDVLLGGGLEHFSVAVEKGDASVLAYARSNGFNVLTAWPDGGPETGPPAAETPERVLGLFAPGHLPVRLRGEGGRIAERATPSLLNMVNDLIGSVVLPEPLGCEANPGASRTPTLMQMTSYALDKLKNDFLLVVESASIDKQAHARNACGHIGELDQLDQTVDQVLKFAAEHNDTLVLVTADHGHAAQLVPERSMYSGFGVPVFSPGHIVRLKTPEGGLLGINYATNEFFVEEHTGVDVPLFANDAGLGRIPAMIDQTEIYTIIRDFLDLDEGKLQNH